MKDFSEQEWQEVCERMKKHILTHEDNIRLNESLKMIYNLNEKFDRHDYLMECYNMFDQIHYALINICCLGTNIGYDMINHWCQEIKAFSKNIISHPTGKQVNRYEIAFDVFTKGYLDKKSLTYDNNEVFIQAMKTEIKKSKISNKTPELKKRQATYIELNIIPNIDYYIEINQYRVSIFWKSFFEAIIQQEIIILNDALETFINTKVE